MVDSIKSEVILPFSKAQEHLEVGQFLLPPDGTRQPDPTWNF